MHVHNTGADIDNFAVQEVAHVSGDSAAATNLDIAQAAYLEELVVADLLPDEPNELGRRLRSSNLSSGPGEARNANAPVQNTGVVTVVRGLEVHVVVAGDVRRDAEGVGEDAVELSLRYVLAIEQILQGELQELRLRAGATVASGFLVGGKVDNVRLRRNFLKLDQRLERRVAADSVVLARRADHGLVEADEARRQNGVELELGELQIFLRKLEDFLY